ncbi:MAG: hypothetical protein HKN25_01605 [Pyrinomonadaceae bacterium]|nr:hypothetical protein [Pyrinomonadaceae bacterium]
MQYNTNGGGRGGFKLRKGMFGFGMFLVFIVPLVSVPMFIFAEEIEKMLSVPGSYSGTIFLTAVLFVVGGTLLGMVLLFGAFLIPLFSMMGSKNKVLKHGTPAEAKILKTTDSGTRINNNPLVNFTLEVKPLTQQPFQVQASQTVSVIHLPLYQPGKIVNVKYIPGTNEVAIVGAKNELGETG